MTEKSLHSWLVANSPRPSIWTRIESWASPGFPDTSYFVRGYGSGLMELKILGDLPPTRKELKLEATQLPYLLKRGLAGDTTTGVLGVIEGSMLLYVPASSPFLREKEWVDPASYPNIVTPRSRDGLIRLLRYIHLGK